MDVGAFLRTLAIVLAPSLLLAAPVVAVLLAVEREPLVPPGPKLSFDEVKRAHGLVERYDPRALPPGRVTVVHATEADLKSVLASGLAPFERLSGDVALGPDGITVMLTAALPASARLLGRYVNMRVTVAPSPSGLAISRLTVGRISVPPALVAPALDVVLGRLAGAPRAADLLESIRSVEVAGEAVAIAYRPSEGLFRDLVSAARNVVARGDPESVRVYYARIVRLVEASAPAGRASLIDFMRPIFALARERSQGGDPVAENRAAILALAVYFGDARFARLIGEVRNGAFGQHAAADDRATLGGRNDLVRHFLVSAGLALTGGHGVADLLGEAKEVADSNGGTGFSFADLAADRAGVRFAGAAVASEASARRVQAILSGAHREGDVLPDARDLPEGLRELAFRRDYRDINDPAYFRLRDEIERRIDAIPLYR